MRILLSVPLFLLQASSSWAGPLFWSVPLLSTSVPPPRILLMSRTLILIYSSSQCLCSSSKLPPPVQDPHFDFFLLSVPVFLLSIVPLLSMMPSDCLRGMIWIWIGRKAHSEDAWKNKGAYFDLYSLPLIGCSWFSKWSYRGHPAPVRRNSQLEGVLLQRMKLI